MRLDAEKDRFIYGSLRGDVTSVAKSWISYVDTPIHSGEGPISALEWCSPFVAWACETGVKVYNVETSLKVTFVRKPANQPDSATVRPQL